MEQLRTQTERHLFDDLLQKLPINDETASIRIWPRNVNTDSLYSLEPSESLFSLKVERNPSTGKIIGYREILEDGSSTGAHSLSLSRPPGPPEENLLGSVSKLPFLPGGMEQDWEETRKKFHSDPTPIDFDTFDLHCIPPGLQSGINFAEQSKIEKTLDNLKTLPENSDIFAIMDFLSDSTDDFSLSKPSEEKITKPTVEPVPTSEPVVGKDDAEVGELLEKPISKFSTVAIDLGSATAAKLEIRKEYKWARWIDVNQPVTDFNRKIPNLAYSYPFELDIFQKQAVLHLEAGDSVFVAAHTSAGKTAVAEYAIALCKKHMTRAIYTSPIKALSNQKFRDFKQTFDQVGLITGDIQLNQEAFCLIMTTEILRSMLLNGSEVIRELEWVIFDEVHYINDAERGVVWEEVLIFLPKHCKIIMLSATVTNVMDFAEWVGQIKQRNVFVISTPKRPVPLEHFLVLQMQTLCKQGLAVHHSGILPIMKEAVEMLFQKNYIKILFATETFAMGVNMPARTVIFDNTRKHDGKQFRDLEPHEYTQMAGRAGRRGLDKTGTVIILCKRDVPEASDLKKMILGKPAHLDSQFRVTYSLLLNLLRVEQFRVEDVLKRSFVESVSLREATSRKERLTLVEEQMKSVQPLNCRTCLDGNLNDYYDLCVRVVEMSKSLNRATLTGKLNPGVYLVFSAGGYRNCLGLALSLAPSVSGKDGSKSIRVVAPRYEVPGYFEQTLSEDILSLYDTAFSGGRLAKPILNQADFEVITIESDNVISVSNKFLKPAALNCILDEAKRRETPKFRNEPSNENVCNLIREIQRLALAGEKELTFFDPSTGKDVNLNDLQILELARNLRNAKLKLKEYQCVHCLCFKEHFEIVHKERELKTAFQQLTYQLSEDSLQLTEAYRQKLSVLKHLGYVDENKVVTLKGRVACHLNQYELLMAEMMLENLLSPLNHAEIAALLSCLTCQQKIEEQIDLPQNLQELRKKVEILAENICACQKMYRVTDYNLTELLHFDLMNVVYEWAKGTPFYQIMQMTSAQEGIIVRCIQRLDEVCRDVRSAARLIGDPTLQRKMEETSALIKRDIVFAASLYTTM